MLCPLFSSTLSAMSDVEARLSKLEDAFSDWSATTRSRWEGMQSLNARMMALVDSKEGLWRIKTERILIP